MLSTSHLSLFVPQLQKFCDQPPRDPGMVTALWSVPQVPAMVTGNTVTSHFKFLSWRLLHYYELYPQTVSQNKPSFLLSGICPSSETVMNSEVGTTGRWNIKCDSVESLTHGTDKITGDPRNACRGCSLCQSLYIVWSSKQLWHFCISMQLRVWQMFLGQTTFHFVRSGWL